MRQHSRARSRALPLVAAALTLACHLAARVHAQTPAPADSQEPKHEPELLSLTGDLDVHDPVVIKHKDTYYLFATTSSPRRGGIIAIKTSRDLHAWRNAGFAFSELPAWVREEVPLAKGAWAPDIAYFNGRYHLYYSLSSFGVNHSAIGLATNVTLDPASADYRWQDQGLVIRSRPGENDFNAIDPHLVFEDAEHAWLSWGSFWGGIMMRSIDPNTSKPLPGDETVHVLAARPRQGAHQTPPVSGAIEAPFIVRHGEHWYLFVSWDFCCRGARSDYKVVVGRSEKITGPYLDRTGKAMTEGGGTLLIEAATDRWRGAGHNAILHDAGVDYFFAHAYDARTGRGRLQISTLTWPDGWPKVAKLP